MLRRDPRPADRRGAPAGPGPTGTTRAVRLRVSPQRHPNLFVTFDPYRGGRNVKVTDRRAAVDYAHCMRELVDVHYPGATCIRVVQDNLSIHEPGALYEAFAPAEARRILRRLEFHFTPKHASWLNMVVSATASTTPKGSETRSPHGNGGETHPSSHQMDVHNRQSPRQTRPRLSSHRQGVNIAVMNH
ncbi:transposase [Bradyrhizobium sp. S3.2.12]|uniref:transposase n=1 Tax=Bradyrhizobium sp. S3.2.12 TaxID=3156387 RepID=UPI00339409B7